MTETKEWADWQRGAEYVAQEGSELWQKLREERGWSREDVEEKTDLVCWERQTMFEDRPDMPDLQELEALATIYETSPGALLDRCFEEKGKELREEEEAEPVCPNCGGRIIFRESSGPGSTVRMKCERGHEFVL